MRSEISILTSWFLHLDFYISISMMTTQFRYLDFYFLISTSPFLFYLNTAYKKKLRTTFVLNQLRRKVLEWHEKAETTRLFLFPLPVFSPQAVEMFFRPFYNSWEVLLGCQYNSLLLTDSYKTWQWWYQQVFQIGYWVVLHCMSLMATGSYPISNFFNYFSSVCKHSPPTYSTLLSNNPLQNWFFYAQTIKEY